MSIVEASSTYSVGYAPASFPRDPVEVNQFHEHMFLGQVLEPLVDSDRFGQVKGGIGESWTFEDGGKRIVFKLNPKKRFSTGAPVKPQDVVYSISRHLGSRSQSALFLADIESLKADGADRVVVRMKQPNVAVIKALSRDQLGIVPDGWKFDARADEPFTGTGPYRLLRDGQNWRLAPNAHYPDQSIVRVKNWRVRKLEGGLNEVPIKDIPDFVPSIPEAALTQLRARAEFKPELFEVERKHTYSQTSFWIFPTSRLFKNRDERARFAVALDPVIQAYAAKFGYTRATGLIPLGISGHNPQKVLPETAPANKFGKTLKIAYLKGVFADFFASEAFKKFTKDLDLKVELIPFEPTTLADLKGKELDLITGSWAGGYSDPTGFLGLLTPMLGMSFDEYLGNVSAKLEAAKAEADWNLRATKFQAFDRALVESGLLMPGWQTPTYSVMRKSLTYQESQSRYTERFVNVSER